MKQKKILSIIIPAYNTGKYLPRCIESLLSNIKNLELIIVNDGSEDDTLLIAKKYKKNYIHDIKIIHKTNGGHGSTVNAGLAAATGKYVRILDSDDWFDTKNLDKYLAFLEKQDADIVLTEFSTNNIAEKKITPFNFSQLELYKKLNFVDINNIPDNPDKIKIFSIHTITIKTELIKQNWGNGLLEKTFYEDQEYVTKCILAAENFVAISINIYQYFIGRNEQSMNSDKMFKNRKQHEKVIFSILDLINTCSDEIKKEFLSYRLKKIIKTHYWIYFYNINASRKTNKEYYEFKKRISAIDKTLFKDVTLGYKVRLCIGRNKNKLLKKG